MQHRITARVISLACLALALATAPAAAQAVNVDQNGVAANGHDVVAYFADHAAEPGKPGITAQHAGATYRFASTAHRDAFVADPARYLPVYGGYCAYGVANGHKVKTDPEAFTIVDGKLYLNYSSSVLRNWRKDIPGYIAKADGTWPGLREGKRDD